MFNDLFHEIKDLKSHCTANLNAQNVIINFEKHTIEIIDPFSKDYTVKYIPTTTSKIFHESNDRVRVIRGHVGSGKTTAMCAEIIFRAAEMPRCRDGVRRSRWAIIRNTYGDLTKTTIHTWQQWWHYLGHQKVRQTPSYSIIHTFNDGKGLVEMILLPIALDNVIDVSKHLKSLEVTGVFLNELSELHWLVLDFFSGGRLPRYPRKVDFDEKIQSQERIYWSGIFADTNPPDRDSWIYNLFEVDHPKEYTMFVQPPAVLKTTDGYVINPAAENICNIPNGEQEFVKMTYGKSDNFISVYLEGNYGTISEEKKIYHNYNDNFHSVDKVKIYENYPLMLGADLGTVAPVILVAQFVEGHLGIIKEFCGEFITIDDLVSYSVLPWLRTNCDKMTIGKVIYDPAKTLKGHEQLQKHFDPVTKPAPTNVRETRINSVTGWLNRLVRGQPAIQIDREGCPQLRKGFNGKYYYRRLRVIGEETYTEEPYKNHPYSDVHDSLQYICCELDKELSFDEVTDEEQAISYYELRQKREREVNKITGY